MTTLLNLNLSIITIIVLLHLNPSFGDQNYNILSFGANPNGLNDSTDAFLDAWTDACDSTGSTTIYVPKGRYLVRPMVFEGRECITPDHITIRIDGTFVGSLDYRVIGQVGDWFGFRGVNNVSIIGGLFDAKGAGLWACKAAGDTCPNGATTMRFTGSNNIRIDGVLSLNSQMFHIVINGCQNVDINNVRVIAPGNSPNTDGIHVQQSTDVTITNSTIKTGDDCVSIGPGTKNLWIERLTCGPGHGISIGSLAKNLEEEGVENVTVKSSIFTGTQNGLRIKSWARPSNGFVQGVQFLDVVMHNVHDPIIIDQNYCPHHQNCPDQASGVKISDVTYENIKGTSASLVAIKFDCSSTNHCTNITLQDVNIRYNNETAQTFCSNVIGKALGFIMPNNCL